MPMSPRRPSDAARRFGYIAAAAVTTAMLYVINVWPGWRELPFLTDDTMQVLGLFNLSLLIGVAVNVVYVAYDPPWLRSLGDLVTTGVGLTALIRVWRVFPFDFSAYSVDWGLLTRFVLAAAIVGSVVGMIAQTVSLIRQLADTGVGGSHAATRRS